MPVESYNGYRRDDDYYRDVARGAVTGAQPFSAYGSKTTAGAGSGVVWPNGTYAFPPAAGVQLSVVSDDAADDSTGTGIQSIRIHGLDADLNPVIETLTMDGTTPVLTVRTDWRFVQCVHMYTFGSGKKAAGNISLTNGGNTYSYIEAGAIRCSSSVRMVPKGKRLLIVGLVGGAVSGTAAASVVLNLASPHFLGVDYTADNVFFPLAASCAQDSTNIIVPPCPPPFTEGQSVGLLYDTDKASIITGTWFGVLEDAI